MSLANHPHVSDWLTLRDGQLYLRTGKVDIGQRISTALMGIVHHELDLPLNLIGVEPVSTDTSPNEGMTSGSNSIEQSGHAIRCACATLRLLIGESLCHRFGGAWNDWIFEKGMVRGPGINSQHSVLALIAQIGLDHPVDQDAPKRAPVTSAMPLPMHGLHDLVRGSYSFIQDLEQPDMLHARVLHPPQPHARLVDIKPETIERLEHEGLKVILDGSFVALVGPREWPVVRGLLQLSSGCTWDAIQKLSDTNMQTLLQKENALHFVVENGVPQIGKPVPPPLAKATHTARYERPFTMHGSLAPSAACAKWNGQRLEIITHSQGIYILRDSIAESLDLATERVHLRFMPSSGCYGHNGADDAAYEAALIAMAVHNKAILLKWSRDDEHSYEPYGPASATEISLDFDTERRRITSYSAEAIGGTFRGRPRSGPDRAGPARLLANHYRSAQIAPQPALPNLNHHGGLHRNLDPIYEIPQKRLVKNLIPTVPLRTSALRCLGAALNVFALESLLDEVSRDIGMCPIMLRRTHLSNDGRALAVLDRLEREAKRFPELKGGGRGLAYSQYKNAMTRVGAMVDLTVTDGAKIVLDRIVLVADAGRIVDRDGLEAQLEGGALQAASWGLYEKVKWDRHGITSRDWDSYQVLRFTNVPKIETVLLENSDCPSVGAGEASPGPVLAAIANAVYDATGLRARRLPMDPTALVELALQD
jgi:CO/xanthine dehydrogenase Mo-binding subunit